MQKFFMEKKDFPQMFNRRYDDVVIVLNHEIKILNLENPNVKFLNKIYIEYFNNFGEKFFGFEINQNEKPLFNKIINRKMAALFNDFFDEEQERLSLQKKNKTLEIKDYNSEFLNFFRKITQFSMKDAFGVDQQMNIKIFPISSEVHKNIINNYYYLIASSLELEIEFAKFKIKFFSQMKMQNKIDQYFDAFDLNSCLNEIKVLCAFKKKFPNVEIVTGTIEIHEFYKDHVLISSALGSISSKIRSDDFIGVMEEKKIMICLFNCSYVNGKKVFERLINLISSNSYISQKYKNQINNLFSYYCMEIQNNDDQNFVIHLVSKDHDNKSI
jgi:hypothetical protein